MFMISSDAWLHVEYVSYQYVRVYCKSDSISMLISDRIGIQPFQFPSPSLDLLSIHLNFHMRVYSFSINEFRQMPMVLYDEFWRLTICTWLISTTIYTYVGTHIYKWFIVHIHRKHYMIMYTHPTIMLDD